MNDASFVLIDNKKMEIIVMLGGIDYFGENGQINGALMPRQPASTIKPFTYALAIERRKITPATILPDIYTEFPSSVGKYVPRNYNGLFHGPVRAAVALGSSHNVPSVYVLALVGLTSYYEFLKKIGFSSIKRSPDFYGLGLTLGNADVTLLELTHAYTIFPNLGVYKPLSGILSIKTLEGKME